MRGTWVPIKLCKWGLIICILMSVLLRRVNEWQPPGSSLLPPPYWKARRPWGRGCVSFYVILEWFSFNSSASTWFKVYITSVATFVFFLFFSQYTRTQMTSPWCWDPGVVMEIKTDRQSDHGRLDTSLCIMRSSTPAWFCMISKSTSVFTKETWFSHSKTWKFTKKWKWVATSINSGVFEWLVYLVPNLY